MKTRELIEDSEKFLLSRDLLSVELPEFFNLKIALNEDFTIFRLPANKIIAKNIESEELKYLLIKSFGKQNMSFQIDEIDEILIKNIGTLADYKSLIAVMLNLLEDAKEIKEEFISLITDKLYFFLKHKIIGLTQ